MLVVHWNRYVLIYLVSHAGRPRVISTHWNPHKIEFPQTKYSVQEEIEGQNVPKVTICFTGETPGDTYHPIDGYTRGDFRSHSKEVVVHAVMGTFHRRIVSGVAVTTTHASAILTVNRDKKH